MASFAAKADRSVDGQRLFTDPLAEITDQVGLRVITFLRDDVNTVANLLGRGDAAARRPRHGPGDRRRAGGATPAGTCWSRVEGEQQPASIQVRTVLQHAWAEFEHDIRYKGSIPEEDAPDLDRRFTLAAGLFELADREFSAIRERLRSSPPAQRSEQPEPDGDPRIATPVLATYLGNRFADAGWSRTEHYAWISGLLLELGIDSLEGLDAVLDTVDTEAINPAWAIASRPAPCAASTTRYSPHSAAGT